MRPHRPFVLITEGRAHAEKRLPVLGGTRPPGRPVEARSRAGSHWRAVVAAVGGCAAVVAGALVVANVHNSGQRVTIRPAAQSGLVPGTILVANSTAALPSGQPVGAALVPSPFTALGPPATPARRPLSLLGSTALVLLPLTPPATCGWPTGPPARWSSTAERNWPPPRQLPP